MTLRARVATAFDRFLSLVTGSVRRKLIALVLICLAPALISARVRFHDARADAANQIHERMRLVRDAFNDEVRDTLGATHQQLAWASGDPALQQLLNDQDRPGLERFIAQREARMPDVAAVALDSRGTVLASSSRVQLDARAVVSLARLLSAAVSAGPTTMNDAGTALLLPAQWRGARTFMMAAVEPIGGDGNVIGAIAMLRPMDTDFLEHCAQQLGTEWALIASGELVARSNHFETTLLARLDATDTVMDGKHFISVEHFAPDVAVDNGARLEVAAARDVTMILEETALDFFRSLLVLGVSLAVAGILAFVIASKMARTLSRMSASAKALTQGRYETIERVSTRDELRDVVNAFNQAILGLQERDLVKERFGKYVTRQVAQHILQNETARLGGETMAVTVLFADIRGFTGISEKMQPKALLELLNLYFTHMVDSVMRHEGIVDKFIGDALMAYFGAPLPLPDHALRAVRAALEMRAQLKRVNAMLAERGLPEIRFGIGMHSGVVVAGSMGHQERLEYTVIGDPVNVASRLEGMTKELGVDIVLSEDTYESVKDFVVAEPLKRMQVRGRQAEVTVYRLVGLVDAATQAA